MDEYILFFRLIERMVIHTIAISSFLGGLWHVRKFSRRMDIQVAKDAIALKGASPALIVMALGVCLFGISLYSPIEVQYGTTNSNAQVATIPLVDMGNTSENSEKRTNEQAQEDNRQSNELITALRFHSQMASPPNKEQQVRLNTIRILVGVILEYDSEEVTSQDVQLLEEAFLNLARFDLNIPLTREELSILEDAASRFPLFKEIWENILSE